MSQNRPIESLRDDVLNDKAGMLAFIDYGLARDREDYGRADAMYESFYKYLGHIARSNVENIFQYSESPIETIFLNSLVVGFLRSSPTNLHIVPPPHFDMVEAVQKRRSYLELCQEWYWVFQRMFTSG